MYDPFALLGLLDPDAIDNRVAGDAFAAAVRNGVPSALARRAFEDLRVPDRRAAIALLSASQTPTARRLLAASSDPVQMTTDRLARDLIAALVAEALNALNAEAVLTDIVPARDIRQYVHLKEEEWGP